MLKPQCIEHINVAIEAGQKPYRSRSDILLLKLNKGHARLGNNDRLTPAGKHYYEKTQQVPLVAGIAVQRGASTYLIRGGGSKSPATLYKRWLCVYNTGQTVLRMPLDTVSGTCANYHQESWKQ